LFTGYLCYSSYLCVYDIQSVNQLVPLRNPDQWYQSGLLFIYIKFLQISSDVFNNTISIFIFNISMFLTIQFQFLYFNFHVIEEIGHEHNDVLCLGFKEHGTSDNTINAFSYSLKKEE
jgi:hypothetical protein